MKSGKCQCVLYINAEFLAAILDTEILFLQSENFVCEKRREGKNITE